MASASRGHNPLSPTENCKSLTNWAKKSQSKDDKSRSLLQSLGEKSVLWAIITCAHETKMQLVIMEKLASSDEWRFRTLKE